MLNRQRSRLSRAYSRRFAFTFVELLIVVAIISLLLAIILPAIQRSRGASRRLECVNHLKQIGLAVAAHESVEGRFIGTDDNTGLTSAWGLYGTSCPRLDWEIGGPIGKSVLCPIFTCPSDSISAVGPQNLRLNYFANGGLPHRQIWGNGNWYGIRRGYGVFRSVTANEVVDGLSQTAMASERLRVLLPPDPVSTGQQDADGYVAAIRAEPNRGFWKPLERGQLADSAHALEESCDAIDTSTGRCSPVELTAVGAAGQWNLYTHALPPNHLSCFAFGTITGPASPSSHDLTTATSGHSGGVNVLYCDGHVSFASSSIAKDVWHAIGTSSAGEL